MKLLENLAPLSEVIRCNYQILSESYADLFFSIANGLIEEHSVVL